MVTTFDCVTTDHTKIRLPTGEDAAFIATLENDVELKRFLGGPSGKSEDRYRKSLEKPRQLSFLIIESLDSGLPIGRCGLMTPITSDECEVHIILAKNQSGRGIGSEVALKLCEIAEAHFPKRFVTAKVHPENVPSLVIIAKLGFCGNGRITSNSYDHGWLRFRRPLETKRSDGAQERTADHRTPAF
jgi:RimJ/RimL family protein N-acetyltransferase